jgi:hypothetical protein
VLDHPEDEQFETYLKQFRPLVPDLLPVNQTRLAPRRHFGLTIRAAGPVVAMAIVGTAGLLILNHRRDEESYQATKVKLLASGPLTVRRADDLLASAPSYKALMSELTFPPKSSPVPKDKQSALAVLSKEKIKL